MEPKQISRLVYKQIVVKERKSSRALALNNSINYLTHFRFKTIYVIIELVNRLNYLKESEGVKMNIGDSIVITNPNSDNSSYRCKIIDTANNLIFVDYPIEIMTNKSVFIPLEQPLIITFMEKGKVYEFTSNILQYNKLTVPALAIPIPKKEEIRQIQRREFVRIETSIDIALHCPDTSFAPFTSVTYDISAGGACVIVPSKLKLKQKQIVQIYFVLKMDSANYEYFNTNAEIIRIHQSAGVHMISIKFLFNGTTEQDKIMYYCFNKQRELRKKEIH